MSITYASLATLQKFQQEVDSRYAKKFTLGLAKQSTATSGYAATYKLTLDGVQVGDKRRVRGAESKPCPCH